ncbi:oxysterol-binding protein [Pseudomaricurvus alkylphenolicus]|uniref:oxysterol-binding protein n=1 Tax=Pseudomaricurvus alkylphenolicus TaxID=1306991 RepID=UPI00141E267E|nr:oxysterol-binding protein [Pseudomaricurvus alkylphenolicus]NIB43763.1 oxysterol-binding protein [Pseudomaricurvus alkylphenolicus]
MLDLRSIEEGDYSHADVVELKQRLEESTRALYGIQCFRNDPEKVNEAAERALKRINGEFKS